MVLFTVMNAFQMGALAGFESYKKLSKCVVFTSSFYFVLCLICTNSYGLNGALLAMVAGSIVRWLVFAIALKKVTDQLNISLLIKNTRAERKLIFGYAIPAAVGGLTSMPSILFGNILLVRQEVGFAEMGSYAAINNLRVLMLLMPLIFNNVGFSILNNFFGSGDAKGYSHLYRLNFKITALLAIFGFGVIALFGPSVLSLYRIDSTATAENVSLMLAFSIIFEAISVAMYQSVQVKGRMWLSLWAVSLPRDISMIVFSLLLIPEFGATGLATAYTLSWLVALLSLIIISLELKFLDIGIG